MRQSTFFIPSILAVLSLFGLIVALIYDGVLHIPAWVALSAPIAAIAVALASSRVSR